MLAAMGVYQVSDFNLATYCAPLMHHTQDGVAKNVVAGKPVTAHIYEVRPLPFSVPASLT